MGSWCCNYVLRTLVLLAQKWGTCNHDGYDCRQWREWVRQQGVPVLMRREEVAEIAKDQAQVGLTLHLML